MKKILFDNNKNIVHQNLKLRRVALGLSQSQLAAKMQTLGVNLDQQMISKIEHNARFVTDYELACFAVTLKTTTDALYGDFFSSLQNEESTH